MAAWRKKVGHAHARNRHRPLERQENSQARPLGRLHRQHVVHFALGIDQFHFALRDFVAGMPGDGVTQRGFARAVGPHQGVHFAAANFQIQPLENRLAADGDVQIGNAESFRHFIFLSCSDHI